MTFYRVNACNDEQVFLNRSELERVKEFVYLGRMFTLTAQWTRKLHGECTKRY